MIMACSLNQDLCGNMPSEMFEHKLLLRRHSKFYSVVNKKIRTSVTRYQSDVRLVYIWINRMSYRAILDCAGVA